MFWGSARPSDVASASADATAGRVTSYELSSGFSKPNFWATADLPVRAGRGQHLVWTTSDGRMHVTSIGGFALPDSEFLSNGGATGGRSPAGRAVLQQMRASGAQEGTTSSWPMRTAALAGWSGALLALLTLVTAAPPVAGTRWYWLWVGMFATERRPAGLAGHRPVALSAGKAPDPAENSSRRWLARRRLAHSRPHYHAGRALAATRSRSDVAGAGLTLTTTRECLPTGRPASLSRVRTAAARRRTARR